MRIRNLIISNKIYCNYPYNNCPTQMMTNCYICPYKEYEEDDVDKVCNILKELIELDGVKERFYETHKHDDYIMDLLTRVIGTDIYKEYKENKHDG